MTVDFFKNMYEFCLGFGIIDGFKLPCGCWGLLQEQPVFLTAESSLQSLGKFLIEIVCNGDKNSQGIIMCLEVSSLFSRQSPKLSI